MNNNIKINKVKTNKKQFMNLLLLGDEQENMINKYLEKGDVFALYNNGLKSICVVVYQESKIYEIKNIATYEEFQGKGYGRCLIKYVLEYYKDKCKTMYVGTGDGSINVLFYEYCGFTISHYVKNFFIDNYDHPIFENGKQIFDMVYLKKELL